MRTAPLLLALVGSGSLLPGCAPTAAPESVTLSGTLSTTDAHAATFDVDGGPGPIVLTCTGGDDAHVLHADAAPATLLARGLLADTDYICVATIGEVSSDPVRLTPPPLPDGLAVPVPSVVGDPAVVGFHLVNVGTLADVGAGDTAPVTDEFLVIYDADGQPRWQYNGVGGGDIDATWLGDDRILFGGFGADVSEPPTILTLDGEIVMRAPAAADTPWDVPDSWHHDAGISADGASIWALEDEEIPDVDRPDIPWEGFVVKQLDRETGVTLWYWSSVEDGLPSGALEPGDASNNAPYHANAVWDTEEPGGTKLYVSLRNESRVIKIDVATKTVEWSLGWGDDFALQNVDGTPATDDLWFSGQHDPKRIGDRFLFYDNGIFRQDAGAADYTRALVLTLDEDARTARIETSWRGGGVDWISPAWGGLDLREDGQLDLAIGHMWWLEPDATNTSALALLRPDGAGGADQVWRVDFPRVDTSLYRSDTLDGCALFDLPAYCP